MYFFHLLKDFSQDKLSFCQDPVEVENQDLKQNKKKELERIVYLSKTISYTW